MGQKKLWFKRKWFDWGWYPASWQGWAVTLGFIALVFAFSQTIDDNSPPQEVMFTFVIPVALLMIAFIRIAYKTGESPRRQWGRPKDDIESDK